MGGVLGTRRVLRSGDNLLDEKKCEGNTVICLPYRGKILGSPAPPAPNPTGNRKGTHGKT